MNHKGPASRSVLECGPVWFRTVPSPCERRGSKQMKTNRDKMPDLSDVLDTTEYAHLLRREAKRQRHQKKGER